MRDYLRRRYQVALTGIVIGAMVMIAAPPFGTAGLIVQMVGAVVFGTALLIAVRTRCPSCHALFDRRAIAAVVRYSYTPPERCPHCDINLNTPRPRARAN